jgi:hypothetical protein
VSYSLSPEGRALAAERAAAGTVAPWPPVADDGPVDWAGDATYEASFKAAVAELAGAAPANSREIGPCPLPCCPYPVNHRPRQPRTPAPVQETEPAVPGQE